MVATAPAATPTASQALAEFIRRARETRYQPLYDSELILDQAAPQTVALFTSLTQQTGPTAGQPKTPLFTNMDAPGMLPAPRQMLIESLACFFDPATPTADLQLLLVSVGAQWFIGDKEYVRGPVLQFPAGLGIDGYIATGVAATTFEQANNGYPTPAARFYLKKPGQLIRSQENFRVQLSTFVDVSPIAANTRVWWFFWGLELRAVQ